MASGRSYSFGQVLQLHTSDTVIKFVELSPHSECVFSPPFCIPGCSSFQHTPNSSVGAVKLEDWWTLFHVKNAKILINKQFLQPDWPGDGFFWCKNCHCTNRWSIFRSYILYPLPGDGDLYIKEVCVLQLFWQIWYRRKVLQRPATHLNLAMVFASLLQSSQIQLPCAIHLLSTYVNLHSDSGERWLTKSVFLQVCSNFTYIT